MDTRLKERLVGAVALVLIVVLVVPELLTGPRKTSPPAATEAPAQVRTVVVDLAHSEADSGPRAAAADAAPVLAPAPAPAPAAAETPPQADADVILEEDVDSLGAHGYAPFPPARAGIPLSSM